MNKKLNFIFKVKKNYKFILYLLVFFVIFFFVYFSIPKFFNYTPKLIQDSLKKNSNINIKNISNINYKFFPSPRLRLLGSNLEFEENILEIEAGKVDIILNPLSIINYKILDYNKLLIERGSSIIEINKVNQLYKYIKKNRKKIIFKKNNIILLKEKNKLFEITDSQGKVNTKKNNHRLNINGLFLNHKTSFILENISDGKTKMALKIPELDISTNIILENNDGFKTQEGLVSIEVLNNFFKFNFFKEKKFKISKGFVRSSLTNTLFEGDLSFDPYFSFNLDVEPSTLSIEKLILPFQKKYFFKDLRKTEIIRKIDGSLNFKNMFEGSIIFKNREIFFQNFKVGKNKKIFFDANISEFGKKGRIQFNLNTSVQNKKNVASDLEISGYVTPLNSKVNFEKIIFDKEIFTEKKIISYEEKFKNEVISNSLSNIFNEKKIKNFFKTF